jgi:predicted DNA repair protein MutK
LLSAFAPWALTPILMLGGTYLSFEAAEKILEALTGTHDADAVAEITDAKALEKRQVLGAIRTDLILSAEIMVIALAQLPADMSFVTRAGALVLVAFAITIGVYGVVALIVKLDDIGLHLSERGSRTARAIGDAMVHVVPKMLTALSGIGTAAMLWVGGGILLHGLEELHILEVVPHTLHEWSAHAGESVGAMGPVVEWFFYALASAVAGLIVGGIIVLIVRRFVKHPEELIVD